MGQRKKDCGTKFNFEELIGLYNLLQRAKIFPAIFLFYLCGESKIREIEKLSLPLFFFTRGVIIQDKEKNFLLYVFLGEIEEKNFKVRDLIKDISTLLLSYFKVLKTKIKKIEIKGKRYKLKICLPKISKSIDEIKKITKKSGGLIKKKPFIYSTPHFVLSWFYKWEGRKLTLEALIIANGKKQDFLNLFYSFKIGNVSFPECFWTILLLHFSNLIKDKFPSLTFEKLFKSLCLLDYLAYQKINKEKKKKILKKYFQKFEDSSIFHSQTFSEIVKEIISKSKSGREKKSGNCLMCKEPIQQGNFCKKCRNIRYRARQFYKILNEKKYLRKWVKNKLKDKEKEEIEKQLNKKLHDHIKFNTYEKYFKDWFKFNIKNKWKFESKIKLNKKEIKLISQKIELSS